MDGRGAACDAGGGGEPPVGRSGGDVGAALDDCGVEARRCMWYSLRAKTPCTGLTMAVELFLMAALSDAFIVLMGVLPLWGKCRGCACGWVGGWGWGSRMQGN